MNRLDFIFDVTVRCFNNQNLNPFTKLPLLVGTMQSILLLGVGYKGMMVINNAKKLKKNRHFKCLG
ncbi:MULTISPECIES: hypothetical protein [Burkholderiaceae]|uniref:hypothetical protein n=1 Tax=Burkholderiaceae TaxID=119060 RepID=UPI0011155C09|nr:MULTISPECIES: hypothetical protein [Burkholderiaceae]MCG1018701.1 hypothetical protein [Mycetohabitans sp. B4]